MNSTEKPRSLSGMRERGRKGKATLGGSAFSCRNSTTDGAGRQAVQVSDFLQSDRENALHLGELKQLLHTDERTVRAMIQRERRNCPILADNKRGYWVSYDLSEVQQFTRSMRGRARQIWQTAANVEKAAGLTQRSPQIDGQMEIQIGDGCNG